MERQEMVGDWESWCMSAGFPGEGGVPYIECEFCFCQKMLSCLYYGWALKRPECRIRHSRHGQLEASAL